MADVYTEARKQITMEEEEGRKMEKKNEWHEEGRRRM